LRTWEPRDKRGSASCQPGRGRSIRGAKVGSRYVHWRYGCCCIMFQDIHRGPRKLCVSCKRNTTQDGYWPTVCAGPGGVSRASELSHVPTPRPRSTRRISFQPRLDSGLRAQQRQHDLFPPTGASDGTPPLRLGLLLPGTQKALCTRDVAPLHHRQPRRLVARRGERGRRALESCGRQHPWYRCAKVGCINTC